MKKVAALLALALASVALVACGSSSDDSSTTTTSSGGETTSGAAAGGGKEEGGGGGGSAVEFEADPGGELAYTTTTASAKAGKVTIDFNNPQALTHDVQIEDAQGKEVGGTELIASGEDSTTVDLKPGTYTYFCSVPGHREAGMEGTLTVK
jgi:plastocyanin